MPTDRERFLNNMRQALSQSEADPAPPGPVPHPPCDDLLAMFSRELVKLGGELVRAPDFTSAARQLETMLSPGERLWFAADRPLVRELMPHLPVTWANIDDLAACQASLTEAQWLVADTATVGLTLDASEPRACYLLPETHIALATPERMRLTLADALAEMEQWPELPTALVFVTGPSRTADIEKTVVIPAHGPKRLIVVLIEQ